MGCRASLRRLTPSLKRVRSTWTARWRPLPAQGVGAGGLTGWSMAQYSGSTTNTEKFFVDNGSDNKTTGAVYSYGNFVGDTANFGNLALGLVGTGSDASEVGLTLVNNFGVALNQFSLSYTGEQWLQNTSTNTLMFGYALVAQSITDASATFVPDAKLNYTGTKTGTAAGLDGQLAANQSNLSDTIGGLDWLPGETLVIRFQIAGTGNASGLAIDNFTFAAQATPTVTVKDAGGPYTGNPYPATALVNGEPSLESVSPTYAYYSGSTATGTPLSGAPIAAGVYTVVASYAGSADYASAVSSPLTFTIGVTPTSKVDPLANRQSTLSFPVTVTGSEAAPGPGVSYYDIYVATNGGPFVLWTSVPASNPTAIFTGQSSTTYAFHSIAHDLAGDVEPKSPDLIEASTYVPDLTAPVTQIVSAVANANGLFTISFNGTAPGGSGIASFTIAVQVDNGAWQTIGQFVGGTATAGVYSGQATYQGILDGASHTYTFSVQGTNGNSIQNTAQTFGPITQTFAAPIVPQVTAFSVEKGLAERSYIRYLDVTFNEPVANLTLNASTVTLEEYALDGVTPVGAIDLTGKISLVDHVMKIDFGPGGIGGEENLPNTVANWGDLTSADGYYKLSINPDGTGNHDVVEDFYRLFGDVIGNAAGGPTTTGAAVAGNVIGALSNADATAIAAAVGEIASAQTPLLNADINGAGSVTSNDRILAAKSIAAGRRLAAGLHIDD